MLFASYFLMGLACLLALSSAVFCLEIFAALMLSLRQSRFFSKSGLRQRVAVVIPAHNEGRDIVPTIDDVLSQLMVGDRLLVVADNCKDDTAEVATAAGAEVIERTQSKRVGRSYALNFALKHLSQDPPSVVVCLDANTRLEPETIHRMAIVCAGTGRPVQALNSMTARREWTFDRRAKEFSWRLKNWVRPFGLSAFGLPCQLTGTGMAFPWDLIRSAKLGDGSIDQEVTLGFDLAQSGRPPLFCLSAGVTSGYSSTQPIEPEHRDGDGSMMLTAIPRLLYSALRERSLGLLALTFDLMVPPLSILVFLLASLTTAGVLVSWHGLPLTAASIGAASLAALLACIFFSWLAYGRDVLPVGSAALAVTSVISKPPVQDKIFSRKPASSWARTNNRG